MVTISFKLSEDEALQLRTKARKAKLSISSFLRQRVRSETPLIHTPVTRTRCPLTGAPIFSSKKGHLPPLTTAAVRNMLAEFP